MTTAAHRKGADLERAAATALNSTRTGRVGLRQRHADVKAITIAGVLLSPEAKFRKRLPRLIVDGLAQAASYVKNSTGLLVIREHRGSAVVCVALDVFAKIAGIDPASLPSRHTPTKRPSKQLDLFGDPTP